MLLAFTGQFSCIKGLHSVLPMSQRQISDELKNIAQQYTLLCPKDLQETCKDCMEKCCKDCQKKALFTILKQCLHQLKIALVDDNQYINKSESLKHLQYALEPLSQEFHGTCLDGATKDTSIAILTAVISKLHVIEKPKFSNPSQLDDKLWNDIKADTVIIQNQ